MDLWTFCALLLVYFAVCTAKLPPDWKNRLDPEMIREGRQSSKSSDNPVGTEEGVFQGDIEAADGGEQSDDSDAVANYMNGQLQPSHYWPNGGKSIPYTISSSFESNGQIEHEIMHALGIFHEQSRPDRDQFVIVYDENIVPQLESNFKVMPLMDTYNTAYDYVSVMHYGYNYFAYDKKYPTILPRKGNSGVRMGQRNGISLLDAAKLQVAYKCPFDSDESSEQQENDDTGHAHMHGKVKQTGKSGKGNNNGPNYWPEGTLPYEIRPDFNFTERTKIIEAMAKITDATFGCVKFVEREDQTDFVNIVKTRVCTSSSLGRQGGAQYVELSAQCTNKYGSIQHELMHALGMYHEMSRPDRDKYVTIHWRNMRPGDKKKFDILPGMNTFGLPYDYQSVMHFGWNDFAKNEKMTTVVPRMKSAKIGQRNNLSTLDGFKLLKAYKCMPGKK